MTSLDFAEAARRLSGAARRAGNAAPGFRSPPRNPNARRSIRWRRNGEAVIAVRVKDRPAVAVLADMIDGVVAANRLEQPAAADLRDHLWEAVADLSVADRGVADAPAPSRSAEFRAFRAA